MRRVWHGTPSLEPERTGAPDERKLVQRSRLRNLTGWAAAAIASLAVLCAPPARAEQAPTGVAVEEDAAAPANPPPPSSAAAVAQSPLREEAVSAFRRGEELWQQGKLAEALVEFERSYELLPVFQVLYYIAAVSYELQRWARARLALESYLEQGTGQLTPAEISEVRARLDELSKRTATLTLTLNVPGAEVHVDGTRLEPTRMGVVLDSGDHLVRVSKPGFRPLEQLVRAAEGQNLHLVLPLTPEGEPTREPVVVPAAPPALPPYPPPSPPNPALAPGERLPSWLPWSITGVLAAGWATTAALAVKARHDRNIIERPGVSSERIDDARRLHIALAVISDVLLVSTLTSAGVSAYLTWVSPPAGAHGSGPHGSGVSGFSVGLSARF